MSLKQNTKNIRELLDALTTAKTDKERLFLLFKIKLLIEIMEEPIKQRSDKKKAADAVKIRIIKQALKQFLTSLDRIFAKHEELGDSHVRDQMYCAIYSSFIEPQLGYDLPAKFGMFTDRGNGLVRMALHKFVTHPEVLAAQRSLKNSEDRFAAFQDGDVKTAQDTTFQEYFGYSNKVHIP